MKKIMSTITGVGLAAFAFAEAPSVTYIEVNQDASRLVTVNYTLAGEAAVTTMSVETNAGDNVWVPIGDANISHVAGDVNRKVAAGDHTFTWTPNLSWPNHRIADGNIRIGVKVWALDNPPDYMAVSLVAPDTALYYPSAEAVPGGVQDEKYKTEYLLMRRIPAANVVWRMGAPSTEKRDANITAASETPHPVSLDKDYYIGVYPVTKQQYRYIMGQDPSTYPTGDERFVPITYVSYAGLRGTTYDWPGGLHQVTDSSVIGKLQAVTGFPTMDLPTDAQWEFACRAGTGSALYDGHELENADASTYLNNLAVYLRHGNKLTKVGTCQPNGWGLYDLYGDVWELCLDYYQENLTGVDGNKGPTSGSSRVRRGGSYSNTAGYCRSATRLSISADNSGDAMGFRAACEAYAAK